MTIDDLAYCFWSVHPSDLDEWLKTAPRIPDGYKGGVRAWFFACEMRKLFEVPQLGGSSEDLRNTLCGVLEVFGIDGAEKILTYALKHRGTNAFDGRPVVKVPPMPETVDRRSLDDDESDGYLESDIDWARNNPDALAWLAHNHAAIRAAISK
ncbi:hypothetical protein [Pararhizobium qamdonense]|uniref:hypothetical protein n=1 Tax=Pararhizobium qamdonense TaxID=3031126 RepID=UPI0023E1F25D|nr:hypothetical protein [Pararhizobium qamdonense]